MTETIRLYDSDPYGVSFSAAVLDVIPSENGREAKILLDRTLFFPEEGGQTPDRGCLAGLDVTDVQIHDGVITHSVTLSPQDVLPRKGDTVSGNIDWEHRYSNMQNHTGEHILSGLMHTLYGFENVGFHLSDNTVTLDPSGRLDDEQLLDLERRANEVVWRNVPVTASYPSDEELAGMQYRSKKEIEGAVRIVTIEGVDACACCAPHVARTGEIGLIKILSAERTKSGMRLFILCGARALKLMQERQLQAERISRLTSMPQENIADGVEKLLSETADLKNALREWEQRYVDLRLSQLRGGAGEEGKESVEGEDGIEGKDCIKGEDGSAAAASKSFWVFEENLSPLSARYMMNELCKENCRFAGVFTGNDSDGWQYLIGSRGDDARIPNAALKESLMARGGGKPEMVQGSVKAKKQQILDLLS